MTVNVKSLFGSSCSLKTFSSRPRSRRTSEGLMPKGPRRMSDASGSEGVVVCAAAGPAAARVIRVINSTRSRMSLLALGGGLGRRSARNPQLPRRAIQVRPLDAERAGRAAHAPVMLFEDGGDVVPFEPQPGLAQAGGGRAPRERAVER